MWLRQEARKATRRPSQEFRKEKTRVFVKTMVTEKRERRNI